MTLFSQSHPIALRVWKLARPASTTSTSSINRKTRPAAAHLIAAPSLDRNRPRSLEVKVGLQDSGVPFPFNAAQAFVAHRRVFFQVWLFNHSNTAKAMTKPHSQAGFCRRASNQPAAKSGSCPAPHSSRKSTAQAESSQMPPELLNRDPQNRLLARQSRLRLEAETIRDAALTAGGLLSVKMLGPGVYPPQPKGIYVVTQRKKNWPENTGADRFRRGMYTYFWRSSPYPFLPTFDAPDANTACTR